MVQPKEKLTLANINQVNNGMFSFYLYNRYGNIVGRVVVELVCLIGHAFTDWNFDRFVYWRAFSHKSVPRSFYARSQSKQETYPRRNRVSYLSYRLEFVLCVPIYKWVGLAFMMIRQAYSISTKICGCLMAVERIKYLSRFTHSFG